MKRVLIIITTLFISTNTGVDPVGLVSHIEPPPTLHDVVVHDIYRLTGYSDEVGVWDVKEPKDVTRERFRSIADDLIEVVLDPGEPNLYETDIGRTKSMSVMLSTIYAESRFRRDVDFGADSAPHRSLDWCLMQIRLGNNNHNDSRYKVLLYGQSFRYDRTYGLSGHDLITDRKSCFRVGLRMLKYSFDHCGGFNEFGLSMYLSGSCSKARSVSSERMRIASILNVSRIGVSAYTGNKRMLD